MTLTLRGPFVTIEPTALGLQKRLGPRALADAEARAGLVREADILAALAGRHAPRLLSRDDEAPSFVMEVIRGRPLDAFVDVEIARACFAALASIHEASDAYGALGIVHGDVSPANVLVEDTARVVYLDFGLARFRGGAPPRDGAFRGTVGFVAPEIARGEPGTPESDVFALAASLLTAAMGRPLRRATGLHAAIVEAADEPIAVPDAPERVRPLVHALAPCLALDPRARPATARAVLEVLLC